MSPEYTRSIHQGKKTNQVHKVQKSMKLWTEEKEQKPNTATQSRRVLRKKSLRSETDLSKSSKCRLFHSRQMHHIKNGAQPSK